MNFPLKNIFWEKIIRKNSLELVEFMTNDFTDALNLDFQRSTRSLFNFQREMNR